MDGLTKILKDSPKNFLDGFLFTGDIIPASVEGIKRLDAKKEIYPENTEELMTIGEKALSRFVNRLKKEIGEKGSLYEKVISFIPYCIGCGSGALTFPVSWPVCAIIDTSNYYKKHKEI